VVCVYCVSSVVTATSLSVSLGAAVAPFHWTLKDTVSSMMRRASQLTVCLSVCLSHGLRLSASEHPMLENTSLAS
jgi:hypothetical protein